MSYTNPSAFPGVLSGSDVNQNVTYKLHDPNEHNDITCLAGGAEMLRVGPDGFWVRGQKVPQDENEAKAVYEAFKQWMTWVQLTRP